MFNENTGQNQLMGEEGFRWFTGTVEKVDGDGDRLGQVHVRIDNMGMDDWATGDLPLAQILMSGTSASLKGVGQAPVGMLPGTRVVGFYLDSAEASPQHPVIMGTLHDIRGGKGSDHGVSALARGVNTVRKPLIGPEPASSYKATYPNNNVLQTKSGHVIEIDDTPQAERIHIYHKSGSYIEINKDGRMIIKSQGESFEVSKGEKTIYSADDINIISEGNITLQAKSGVKVKAPAGMVMTQGNFYTKGAFGGEAAASGVFATSTGKRVYVKDGIITKIKK